MASSRAVADSLKILSHAFSGVVDAERFELWRMAMDDIGDDELKAAVIVIVKTYTGQFIPSPGMVRAAVVAMHTEVVDTEAIVRRIEKLATYSPHVGMIYPPVSVVRDNLGDDIANAYAASGGSQIFSDNETGRGIARREFRVSLVQGAERIAGLRLVGGTRVPRALGPGDEPAADQRGADDRTR